MSKLVEPQEKEVALKDEVENLLIKRAKVEYAITWDSSIILEDKDARKWYFWVTG